jgi:hypothetical protein
LFQVRDNSDVFDRDHLALSGAERTPSTPRIPASQNQQRIGFDRDLRLLRHKGLLSKTGSVLTSAACPMGGEEVLTNV